MIENKAARVAYHNGNTLRAISTLRPAALVLGPSPTDRLVGELRNALASRPGYAEMYAAACAKLEQANRIRAEWRRVHQGITFRNLNAVRAAMRANAKAIAAARAGLLAAGMTLEQIAVMAPGGEA